MIKDDEVIHVLQWAQWMQSWGEIEVHFVPMSRVKGFVRQATTGTFYIMINNRLCFEMQKEVYYHEVKHIYDFVHSIVDELDGLILDELEDEADKFAEAAKEAVAAIYR